MPRIRFNKFDRGRARCTLGAVYGCPAPSATRKALGIRNPAPVATRNVIGGPVAGRKPIAPVGAGF